MHRWTSGDQNITLDESMNVMVDAFRMTQGPPQSGASASGDGDDGSGDGDGDGDDDSESD